MSRSAHWLRDDARHHPNRDVVPRLCVKAVSAQHFAALQQNFRRFGAVLPEQLPSEETTRIVSSRSPAEPTTSGSPSPWSGVCWSRHWPATWWAIDFISSSMAWRGARTMSRQRMLPVALMTVPVGSHDQKSRGRRSRKSNTRSSGGIGAQVQGWWISGIL